MLRKASTVIIVHKFQPAELSAFNYKIFMLKRSAESSFMPNAFVFPGGVFETDDESTEWLKLYDQFNTKYGKNQKFSSSKLTGIREVFEESGLLIAPQEVQISASDLRQVDWRTIVHENAFKFRELFEKYHSVPDVNALTLFSQWTTPAQEKQRFITDFYLTKLESWSEMSADGIETTKSKWMSPEEALNSFAQGEISLAPPTWYTLNEMRSYPKIDDLLEYVTTKKIEPWEPTLAKIDGRLIVALPGDELHAQSPSKSFHRIILEKKGEYKYIKSRL
jgi:nucleoside diphosphate-linked moiety X motif protein 19